MHASHLDLQHRISSQIENHYKGTRTQKNKQKFMLLAIVILNQKLRIANLITSLARNLFELHS